jgi:hypothetical protein
MKQEKSKSFVMHLHQCKLADTGGPQYWLRGIPDHVSGHLQRVKACPVILQTPYGPVETQFVAVEPNHKLVGNKIVKANAQRHQTQKGQSKVSIENEKSEKQLLQQSDLLMALFITGLFHADAVTKAQDAHANQSNHIIESYSKNRWMDT